MSEPSDPDRLARLVDVRDRLESAIANCKTSRDLPALSREYRMTLAELDAVDVKEGTSVVDQLAARRGAKGAAGATGSA